MAGPPDTPGDDSGLATRWLLPGSPASATALDPTCRPTAPHVRLVALRGVTAPRQPQTLAGCHTRHRLLMIGPASPREARRARDELVRLLHTSCCLRTPPCPPVSRSVGTGMTPTSGSEVDGHAAEDLRSTSRLMQVMVATELDRLATSPDDSTGRRLRVLMRMVDSAARSSRPGTAADPRVPVG